MLAHPPKIVALCGHPRHGKSTVQTYLHDHFGVTAMDDGLPIRLAGMQRFGLTWEQVSTQPGKLELCEAFGRTMEVREALGLIGLEHEDENPNHWADEAISLLREQGTGLPVSYGSVRRRQGLSYKRVGGLVVEVFAPGVGEFQYTFDKFDRDLVDITIVNDGDLDDLRDKVLEQLSPYLTSEGTPSSWN